MKYRITNYSFMMTGLLLLLILFIRVTRGLDLTDEMQYYGEIKGLIENGKLFSNDLFIQQSVYILFYPALYIYHILFGFEGLVLFGRLIIATLSVVVFLYAYRKFLELRFAKLVASVTALSLTFAISSILFAPSYNSIAQVMWIIFAIRFFEWKQRSPVSWAAIPVITAFAHPTSAIIISSLTLFRLTIERDFKQAIKVASTMLAGAFLAWLIIINFATSQEYLDSLAFSSGYGVGENFIFSKSGPFILLFIFLMFGVAFLMWKRMVKLNISFALFASLFISLVILLFAVGLLGSAYPISSAWVIWALNTYGPVLAFASLSAFAYAWSINGSARRSLFQVTRIHWLVVLLLAYATALGVTSGNGITQATQAFMVGLPLLLAIAVSRDSNKNIVSESLTEIVCVFLLLVLFSTLWSLSPYREASWWKADQSIQSVPEFKFINTSKKRVEFLQHMKIALDPIVQGKRTLIVSHYPGLYFAFGAQIETCMLYMHSLTTDRSERVLMECLKKKNPEIVVDIYTRNDTLHENPRIKSRMQNFYAERDFDCQEKSISFDSEVKLNPNSFSSDFMLNPDRLEYRLCKQNSF